MDDSHETLVRAWAGRWRHPDWRARPALADAARTLSYGQLHAAVGRTAQGLARAGVEPGDYVAVAMERALEVVIALLGAMAAGACPCPLEPRISAGETARRIGAAGLRWLLHDEVHAPLAEASGLPAARRIRHDALEGRGADWPAPGIAPDAPALLLFTSGSTGNPKGVLLSHRGIANNARGVLAHTGLTPDDVLLHVMPLHHTNALNNQIFTPLLAGARVVLAGRFRAEDMPGLLERFRPTIVTGVPTMYARMLELEFDPASLRGLRFARCGSAPITEALHRRIEALLGCPLVVSYGLSEATCTSTMNPPRARRVGTVGTVLAGQAVTLRLADGSLAPPGGEGEICIEGDSLMLGYLGAQATGGRPAILRTGDLGRFDADGYLSITGRIKDVIIRGGENISPALVEGVIAALPGVAACCVVGAPDEDLGEAPVAFVTRAPGAAAPEAPAICAAVLEALGRIYVPREVHWVDALPENAVGKVDRKALARRLAGGAPARARGEPSPHA